MARNKLEDLNNHLFAQLERLGDEDMDSKELEEEIKRAKGITDVAKQVIDNARLSLEGARFVYDEGTLIKPIPEQFKVNETNK